MDQDTNPYRAGKAALVDSDDVSDSTKQDAVSLRKEHIDHETSIRLVLALIFIIGGLLCAGVNAGELSHFFGATKTTAAAANQLTYAAGLFFGIVLIAAGVGLSILDSGARWIAVVLSSIGLIGVPYITLMSVFFLYLLLSKKGQVVFSSDYQDAIKLTPELNRVSPFKFFWIVSGALLSFIAMRLLFFTAS